MSDATVTSPAATPAAPASRRARSGGAALLVAAGILLSRVFGLVRQRVFGHYLGTSDAADAFTLANKIPNFLQNLLGEGVLSASFIPVYAALRARGEEGESRRVAGAVAALLGLVTLLLAVAGIAAAPALVSAIAPGFEAEKRELTIRLVRIFFPAIALLVASALCIGVLNTHGRFFLSYAAPVISSLAVIAAFVLGGEWLGLPQDRLAVAAVWGFFAGAALQLLLQLPPMLRLLGGRLNLNLGRGSAHVREIVRNFFPVLAGRGVVQISAFIDVILASLLPSGAAAAIGFAQLVYLLPISLFAMSVSAAALPSMSEQGGGELGEPQRAALRDQLASGLRTIAYPVVPTVVGYVVLGDVVCGALFQTGRFGAAETRYAWLIVAGYSIGLLAATQGRLVSSVYYALRDTRTPLRYAIVRVLLSAGIGAAAALWLPQRLGIDAKYGAVFLGLAASLSGWVELTLLRRKLSRRIGAAAIGASLLARLFLAAIIAAGAAWLAKEGVHRFGGVLAAPIPRAAVVLGIFGLLYAGLTLALRVPEATATLQRVRRIVLRKRG